MRTMDANRTCTHDWLEKSRTGSGIVKRACSKCGATSSVYKGKVIEYDRDAGRKPPEAFEKPEPDTKSNRVDDLDTSYQEYKPLKLEVA